MTVRVLVFALLALVPSQAFAQPAACRAETTAAVQVVRATDGRTVLLDDGREIRLAGIDVPLGSSVTAETSRAGLERRAAGRTLRLSPSEPATDRYGRLVADLCCEGEDDPLQTALVRAGLAKASGHPGPCAAQLRSAEDVARSAQLGLWAQPGHALRRADESGELATALGQFAVAEGKVLSVRRSGGTIYLNFGRRWRESLTVTISAPRERMFAQAGLPPHSLEGRLLRVRGHVEDRNGPVIEALRPEQIEIVTQ